MMPAAPLPIGILFSSFDPGGTERQMSELVRRLDRTRWQVHIGCFRAEGAWLDRVRDVAPVTDFHVRSLRSAQTLRQANAFARWCTERHIAVLHTADLPIEYFRPTGGRIRPRARADREQARGESGPDHAGTDRTANRLRVRPSRCGELRCRRRAPSARGRAVAKDLGRPERPRSRGVRSQGADHRGAARRDRREPAPRKGA